MLCNAADSKIHWVNKAEGDPAAHLETNLVLLHSHAAGLELLGPRAERCNVQLCTLLHLVRPSLHVSPSPQISFSLFPCPSMVTS